MKKYTFLLFFISFTLVKCSKGTLENNLLVNQINNEPTIILTGSNVSPIPISGCKFIADVPYDIYSLTKFDLFIPNSSSPTNKVPLVIYVHGGGFVSGDKTDAYSNAYTNDIQYYINNNIAFLTVNYRLTNDNQNGESVLNSIKDVKRCLQTIKYYSSQFNIDKTKVAMYGGSAGGGATLWIGLQSDMANPSDVDPVFRESTILKGLGHINSQASYSPSVVASIFLANGGCQFPNPSTSFPALDLISFMSTGDPEIFIYQPRLDINCTNLLHHPVQTKALYDKANSVGIATVSYIPAFNIGVDPNQTANENLSMFMKRKLQ